MNKKGNKKGIVKVIGIVMVLVMLMGALAACANNETPANSTEPSKAASQEPTVAPTVQPTEAPVTFDNTKEITVVSREEGSGTRGAFIELTGVQTKDADGKKIDNTTVEATITNSTEVMLTTVAGDKYAIGYISLGSLNDTVKALNVEGIEATVANIKNETYPIVRPFNIVTNGEVSTQAKDFINFIMSAQGQKIVSDNHYVTVNDSASQYAASGAKGKIVVAGSSSVTPLMEKLKEAYVALNPDVNIEVQQSDSTTGINNTIEGVCDIGMSSRELKDTETAQGLTPTVICKDGIAIIVNNENPLANITKELVRQIFVGEIFNWNEVE